MCSTAAHISIVSLHHQLWCSILATVFDSAKTLILAKITIQEQEPLNNDSAGMPHANMVFLWSWEMCVHLLPDLGWHSKVESPWITFDIHCRRHTDISLPQWAVCKGEVCGSIFYHHHTQIIELGWNLVKMWTMMPHALVVLPSNGRLLLASITFLLLILIPSQVPLLKDQE